MKRHYLLTILLAISIAFSTLSASEKSAETLRYEIVYRWGLVNKQAGRATFNISHRSDGSSHASMCARTEPWADHVYKVRDTLLTTFNTKTRLPSSYTRIAHEGGAYANDKVTFSRNGNTTSASCVRLRRGKKDKSVSRNETSLTANGNAVDLLSSFYYLRGLDFSNMTSGTPHVINIFSGKRKEVLKISYHGIETIKIDGQNKRTHKVTFTFTSENGKTTSSPIKAWLSTDEKHIPLKLEGELKIGKVQCILIQ